ncbi:hypothetical protein ACRYCC_01310 [Actinomadura scrupuli]|uniref:hypothetical protein n=1 Tax=Actinomadura scrupuli TaxID=559629 RepID=UPI003D956B06
MGYPGDQSQSGGWPPEQPSQSPSPYDPGQDAPTSRYRPGPFSPPPDGPPSADPAGDDGPPPGLVLGAGPYEPGPGPYTGRDSYDPGQSAYEPRPGAYEPSSGSYEPATSPYEPGQGGYEPGQGSYEPSQGAYEPAPGSYEPGPGSYDSGQDSFQPRAGAYEPGPGSYEPYAPYDSPGDADGRPSNPYAFGGSGANGTSGGFSGLAATPYPMGGSGAASDPFAGPGPYDGPAGPYEDAPGSYDSGHDGQAQHRGGPLPPERSKMPLIIGAIVGAIVLVAGGFMVFSVLGGDSGKKTASGTPSGDTNPQGTGAPTAPTSPAAKPTAATGPLGAKLKNRATDPQPLTLAEVFKHRRFGRYVMTAKRQDGNCAKVVHGTRFAAALKSGGCTQMLRATFSTTDGKLIGSIGVANLRTDSAAKKVQAAGAGKDAWLLPLPGTGSTKKIGKGSALGTAEARGHYVLLSWVQRPDGKEMTAGQRGTVSTFVSQVILGSNLSPALQYRGISGKPYGT